jgi:hypothetical protein
MTLNLEYNRAQNFDAGTPVLPVKSLGRLAKLDASSIDNSTGTITFASPHGLTDDQAATYLGTPASDATNRGVGNLVKGQCYYVKRLSATAIQLSRTPGGPAVTLTDAGHGTHSFLIHGGIAVAVFSLVAAFDQNLADQTGASPSGPRPDGDSPGPRRVPLVRRFPEERCGR